MSGGPLLLLVELHTEPPTSAPNGRRSSGTPHRSSLSASTHPLVASHLTVSVDPSLPVSSLHVLIARRYDQLRAQTQAMDVEAMEDDDDLPPAHHVRVVMLFKSRTYAVSSEEVLSAVFKEEELVLAFVRVREGPLPSHPPLKTEPPRQSTHSTTAVPPSIPPRGSQTSSPPIESKERELSPQRNGAHVPSHFSSAPASAPFHARASRGNGVAPSPQREQSRAAVPAVQAAAIVRTPSRPPASSAAPSATPTSFRTAASVSSLSSAASATPASSNAALSKVTATGPPKAASRSAVKTVQCLLCGQEGGVFKRTKEGGWCHLVCAEWTVGTRFDWTHHLVLGVPRALHSKTASKRLCCLCNRPKGTSVPLQCSEAGCRVKFHLTCAQAAGMQTAHVDFADDRAHSDWVVYCQKHSRTELEDYEADECAICAFKRPDSREPGRRLTCCSCGVQVHKTCYYGKDEELLSDDDEEEGSSTGERIDWEHWRCMRCEFVEDGVYRLPAALQRRKKVKAPKKSRVRVEEAKEPPRTSTSDDSETQQPPQSPDSPSPPREKQRKPKRKAPPSPAAAEEMEEAKPKGTPASASSPPSPDSSPASASPPKKRRARKSRPSAAIATASTAQPPPVPPPSAPAAPGILTQSDSSVGARYLSDERDVSAPTSPVAGAELKSPEQLTVLKALKTFKLQPRTPALSAADRADYTTRVGAMDVGLLKATLWHHKLSDTGDKAELIARLQATMAPLPAEGEEARRWRSDWEASVRAQQSPQPQNGGEHKAEGREAEEAPPNAAHRAVQGFASAPVLQKLQEQPRAAVNGAYASSASDESDEGSSSASSEEDSPSASSSSSSDTESSGDEEKEKKRAAGRREAEEAKERLQRRAMEEIHSASEGEAEEAMRAERESIEDDEEKKAKEPLPAKPRKRKAIKPINGAAGSMNGRGGSGRGRGGGRGRGRGRGQRIAGF